MDDLPGGGDDVFDCTVLEVKREFAFGAGDVGAMRLKARRLTHMANCDMTIDTEHHWHELQKIEVSKSDKA